MGISLLGDFTEPLQTLQTFLRIKPLAKAIVQSPLWLPTPIINGRTLEVIAQFIIAWGRPIVFRY